MYEPATSLVSRGVVPHAAWVALIQEMQPFVASWPTFYAREIPETIDLLVGLYISESYAFGLNYDLLLAQNMHETAWLTSRRWILNRNPAGLGATGGDVEGAVFGSIGVAARAHYEHVCCYVYTLDTCPANHGSLIDPRHFFHQGHPEVAGLIRQLPEHKWANPGVGYVQAICDKANAAVLKMGKEPPKMEDPLGFLIDIRDQLPIATSGDRGPFEVGITPRQGAIQHYSATPWVAGSDFVAKMRDEASYHINKGWGQGGGPPYGSGIMYHIGVNPDTGEAYLMRDLNRTLWHCGYWGPGGNDSGFAVHVPGDGGLTLTPAGLAGLVRVHDALALVGYDRSMVRGHWEVNPTACPGPLMDQFVYRYRAGEIGGQPVAEAYKDPVTGKTIANAMYDFFRDNGGVALLGRPLTEEFTAPWPDDKPGSPPRTQQICEREVLGFFPENQGAARVQALRGGAIYARSLGLRGVGID